MSDKKSYIASVRTAARRLSKLKFGTDEYMKAERHLDQLIIEAYAHGVDGRTARAAADSAYEQTEGVRSRNKSRVGFRVHSKPRPMNGRDPVKSDYDMRERSDFHRDLQRVEKMPLRERQHNAQEFAHALARAVTYDHNVVLERMEWLLNGSYGKGPYDAAHEVIRNKRMNRAAWLTMTIASLEWHAPHAMSARAWNKLDLTQKMALNKAIERLIQRVLAES